MPSSYQLFVNGAPAAATLYDQVGSLEVEESADLPSALQLTLPVSRSEEGDLTQVNDANFQPYSNLAVVISVEGKPAACVFDGFVLAQRLHVESGITASQLLVWAQDASCLMNLEEKAREWSELTDANVANQIFGEYGFDAAPDNTEDDSPTHTESAHTLMQRASDIQFLRQLARRNGKLCRVFATDTPGQRTGFFAKPNLDASPAAVLTLNGAADQLTVGPLEFEWNVGVPSDVSARQALFNDDAEDGVSAEATQSELTLLDERDLATFAGRTHKALLTTTVDDAEELALRARSLLRESGFFVRCAGEADVTAVGAVLRACDIVQIDGAGSVHSGKYLVWSVKHQITGDAHKMKFTLVRNAVGNAPAGGAGGLLSGVL